MDIDLTKIIRQHDGGAGDMGTVETETSQARFGLSDSLWLLLFVRVNFHAASGATASGTADMAIIRHDEDRVEWQDATLLTRTKAGTDNDVNIRILPDEYPGWTFLPTQQLVLTWTNPDSGDLLWGVEVGLYPVTGGE
jgi:hypothetical protein